MFAPECVITENDVFLKAKSGRCAPRFVSFCSMYGNVLSYPVEDAGVAMRAEIALGGARDACRAPTVSQARPKYGAKVPRGPHPIDARNRGAMRAAVACSKA